MGCPIDSSCAIAQRPRAIEGKIQELDVEAGLVTIQYRIDNTDSVLMKQLKKRILVESFLAAVFFAVSYLIAVLIVIAIFKNAQIKTLESIESSCFPFGEPGPTSDWSLVPA